MLDREVSKKRLLGLLARAFSKDAGKVDPRDEQEIQTFLSSGELFPDEVGAVVLHFAKVTWKIAFADGKVSAEERARLREVVRVLSLPQSALPAEYYQAMMSGP
jgi:Tellurite resistance protein TerB